MNLQQWIERASRGLAPESQARVRAEIEEHYRSAMEEPFATEASVLDALGNPRAANRAYKRVLLTAAESRLIHWNSIGDRHPKAVVAIFLAIALLWAQMSTLASTWVALVLVYEGFLATLPRRGRPYAGRSLVAYRIARMIWAGSLFSAMANVTMPMEVLALLLIALIFYEWTNARLRRKLPPEQWSKAIYLF